MTVGGPRRTACATVATRPGATTTPDPADQPRPRPTTDGPTRSATPAMVDCRSEIVVTPSLPKGSDPFRRVVTCDLQVTVADRPRNLDGMPRGAPPETPLDAALAAVGDRWTLLVVEALLDAPRRFGDLQDALPGIAPNILTARLRQLTDQALVVATPYQDRPTRFVYELSAAARELAGPLRLLDALGDDDQIGHGVEIAEKAKPHPAVVGHDGDGQRAVAGQERHREHRVDAPAEHVERDLKPGDVGDQQVVEARREVQPRGLREQRRRREVLCAGDDLRAQRLLALLD